MSGAWGALLAALFFAPLAFVYGRTLAGRLAMASAASGRTVAMHALPKLVLPLLVGGALLYRAAGAPPSGEGSATLGAAAAILWFLGSAALVLFFLTIPFVLGRLFGIACALLGIFAGVSENPLSFGANGDKTARSHAGERDEMTERAPFVIAIDGPAAAGKGTIAQRLASHYGLSYLDTGLLYRAVGRLAQERGADLDSEREAGTVARALVPTHLDDGSLRGREAGELASRVAIHPSVREALAAFQRDFAGRPEGAVLDGRDIGTVICPDAPVKIFVTASAEVRARRRTDELRLKGRDVDYETILAEVRARDERDSGRSAAPLRPAPDARLLDTSEMDIEAAFRAACAIVDASPHRKQD